MSSGGDDQRIFGGLKFSILGRKIWWLEVSGIILIFKTI